jgi:hypothetical protein
MESFIKQALISSLTPPCFQWRSEILSYLYFAGVPRLTPNLIFHQRTRHMEVWILLHTSFEHHIMLSLKS